ncbi:MAG: hypothetical protein NTY35_16590 [Planctomycetota bacterium]|nr:hypothetical protein [Planctomycetota bacterium]
MKLTTASLTLLAALAALPATATTVVAAPARATTAGEQTPNLRARFNAAIEELQKKAVARGATREDYQRVVDQLTAAAKEHETAVPSLAPLRQRAAARIEDIETRARAGAVDAVEFDALRDSLVDMDLEIALGRLKTAALAGKYTRAEYQGFLDAWTARAASAKDGNPELDAITARAKAALEAIEKRAKEATALKDADVSPLGDCVAEYRTVFAVRALEKKAMAKKATKVDYDDITSAVRSTSGEEMAKKVAERLEQLKTAVDGGRITPEQFAELRTMLMTRARAAASGK